MSLAMSYGMKKRNKCAHGGYAGSCGECYAKGGEAAFKDKKDPDASDQVKATARSKRNYRSIKTPDGEYKRYFKFQNKEGAVPGKEGDKVYGRPKAREMGVHNADKDDRRDLRGKSSAGITYVGGNERKKKYGTNDYSIERGKDMHRQKLAEMMTMKQGPTSGKSGFAEGGDVNGDVRSDEMDLVDRILAKRYSEGGQVANDTNDELAGLKPNQFDDLVLRDDLEFSYDGANSGDEIGNEGEDDRREDIVSRVLRSLRKRAGHNPNPA